jgi:gliding motility-associated-like protein
LKNYFIYSIVCTLFFAFNTDVKGQSGLCTPETPFYNVNLVGDPGGTWISAPPTARAGSCCGSEFPDRCIEFEIILDSNTVAINFEVASGAVPPGALFYKIGCGPEQRVGEPICVDGPGPHVLTFCKPGKNLNTYAITAIPGTDASPDTQTSEGCQTTIGTTGLLQDIVWSDITGGGTYDSYLSCITGCDTVTVTPQEGYPEFVDYQVCGTPAGGPCSPIDYFCDTVRVYFVPPLVDSIGPNPAIYCQPDGGINLGAFVNGGQGPYTYQWTGPNGNVLDSTQSIFATDTGLYQVEIRDALYPNCPAKFVTGNVSKVLPPVVNAGPDAIICASNPTFNLSGTVLYTDQFEWLGAGSFDNSNDLNSTYTPTADEITAGTAKLVLAADGQGTCGKVTDTLIITINPPLEVEIIGTTLLCDLATQDLTARASGGTPNYTYSWASGESDSTIFNTGAGTYTVSVTDQSQSTCAAEVSITVNSSPKIFVDLAPVTQIFCDTTSTVNVGASGGTGTNYTYTWNTGQTGSNIAVSPGEYIVTVTDELGCTAKDTTLVQATNSDLNFTFPQMDNLCFGGSTSIAPNTTGGFQPLTFEWGDGSTSPIKTVTAGDYCLKVTDNLGCEVTKCITVVEDSLITPILAGPDVICKDAEGVIQVAATGGTAPYSYEWPDGSTGDNISVTAGTYTVTVTDNNPNGCVVTESFSLNQSTELTTTVTSNAITCYDAANGSVTLTASGSEGGYTYQWDNGIVTRTTTGLDTGWYKVTVTDQIGCLATDSVYLVNPDSIVINIVFIQNVSCKGGADGSAEVTASGGAGGFTYSWTNGEGSATANGLIAGEHVVTVIDANGCIKKARITITEPDELLVASITGDNLSCFQSADGEITIQGAGGTRPYTYNWAPGGAVDSVATGLSAGIYDVTITDDNGCEVTAKDTLTEPNPLFTVVNKNNDVLCFDESNGQATVSIFGGTTPYSTMWDDGYSGRVNSGLDSGMQVVTITDANGCIKKDSILISEPELLVLNESDDQLINCDSTTRIGVQVQGGTSPFNINWSNGDSGDSTTVNNSGLYIVAVTDANGCFSQDSVRISPLNSTLTAEIDGPSNICANTSISLGVNVNPGVPPYSYEWDDGSTNTTLTTFGGLHSVTVTDSAGCKYTASLFVNELSELIVSVPDDSVCFATTKTIVPNIQGGLEAYSYDWGVGGTSPTADLGVGTYTLNISDSAGCTASDNFEVFDSAPLEIQNDMQNNVTCFGGSDGYVKTVTSGGFAPYEFSWSHDPANETSDTYNLGPADYFIYAIDAAGCKDTLEVNILAPSTPLDLTIDKQNVTCNGLNNGTANVIPSGGWAPYEYLWWASNDTTASKNDLAPGSYNISVLDSGGCVASSVVSITQPQILNTVVNSTNVLCKDQPNGTANAIVSGGTTPYEYSWSHNPIDSSFVDDLTDGTYILVVSDSNNCKDSTQIIVTEPDSLLLNINKRDISCNGENDGRIALTATGGTPIYTYSWQGSAVTQSTRTNLLAGSYEVTVEDNNGCTKTETVQLIEPLPLQITILNNDPLCFNSCDGEIQVNPSGGTMPYQYNYGSGFISDSIKSDFCANDYSVTVRDVNGCEVSEANVQLVAPPEFKIDSAVQEDLRCANICDGSIIVYTNENATYGINSTNVWQGENSFPDLCADNYWVYAKNSNGCVDSSNVTLTAPPVINYTMPVDTTICISQTATFDLAASGGAGSLKYFVNGTDTNTTGIFSFSPEEDTSYTFQILDENGCEPDGDITASVFVRSAISLVVSANDTICAQQTIMLNSDAAGGDGNYQYAWKPLNENDVISTDDSVGVTPLSTTEYEVTISDGCGSPAVKDTVEVTVLEMPRLDFSRDAEDYCVGTQITFGVEFDEVNDYEIQWRFNNRPYSNASVDSATFAVPGNYDLDLVLTSPIGCVFTHSVDSFFEIFTYPIADFIISDRERSIESPVFSFENTSSNEDSIYWVTPFSNYNEENIVVNFDSVDCFPVQLFATNNGGCIDSLTREVCVEDIFQFYAPNAFTPNGNGVNDDFIPKWRNLDESTFKMWIFNRWGENIYYTEDANAPWNGRRNNTMQLAQIDVYVWLVEGFDIWGNKHEFVGTVTILK